MRNRIKKSSWGALFDISRPSEKEDRAEIAMRRKGGRERKKATAGKSISIKPLLKVYSPGVVPLLLLQSMPFRPSDETDLESIGLSFHRLRGEKRERPRYARESHSQYIHTVLLCLAKDFDTKPVTNTFLSLCFYYCMYRV